MLSFLNSTVLFAAAAALIPLIIHLFSRRRVRVVEFSSLRHLKALQKRQIRRLKIRQLLLLLLRMLIILLIVLAFARPTINEGSIGTHAAISAVILVDNSASMNRDVADGSLYDLAIGRTLELLATFGQADEVCIIPMYRSSKQSIDISFTTAAIAAERLQQLKSGQGRADLSLSVEAASTLLDQAINLNRELYFVTDRQRSNLPGEATLSVGDVRVVFVELPVEDIANHGIVALDFGGQLLQVGHDFNLTATIRNYADKPVSELIASLFIDGRRVAQTDFTIEAAGESTVRFIHRVSTTGYHSGYVVTSDDQFESDNRYFFSFSIPDKFSVLIIDGDPSAAFMSLALTPEQMTGNYWSIKSARPGQLAGVNFNDYDVIVLAGIPRLAKSFVSRLKSYAQRGKSLLLTYGPETDITYFNETWATPAGMRYTGGIRPDFSRSGFYTLLSVAVEHPIFSVFNLGKNRLPQIKFYTLPSLQIVGSPHVLARFSGDRPALVENRYGKGRVLCFTGPMAPPHTDLVSHSFFVPMIARMIEYLASNLSTLDTRIYSGDNVARPLVGVAAVTAPIELTSPDASVISLSPEEDRGGLVMRISPATQTGIHTLQYRGREIDRFAVNLNPSEADLTPVDEDQLAASLGLQTFYLLPLDDDPSIALAELRIGRELWQFFLWLVVLLLVAEMWIARGAQSAEQTNSAPE